MGPLEVLTILGLPEALVSSCRDMLEENASSIHDGKPTNVAAGVFGGSDAGQLMEHHTTIAHRHVADALQEMVAGLRGYAENLNGFAKDVSETDLQAAADLTPSRKRELDLATDNLAAPDFHNDRGSSAAGGEG